MTTKETELQRDLNEANSSLNQADFKINNINNKLEVAETNNKNLLNRIAGLKNLIKRLQPLCHPRRDSAEVDQKAIDEINDVIN